MKVYLDTNIVSCIVKNDLLQEEVDSIEIILNAWNDGTLEIKTSKITEEEINNISDSSKQNHTIIYKLIKKVPPIMETKTDSGLMLMGMGGGVREDPLFTKLKEYLDINDARHMFQAIKNGMDIFLTADKGIVKNVDLFNSLGIKVLSPSQLVNNTIKPITPL